MQLALPADLGKSLLFDRSGAELDALEDRGVEDVNSGVDAVSNKLNGLFDKAIDARGVVGLVDNDTVL